MRIDPEAVEAAAVEGVGTAEAVVTVVPTQADWVRSALICSTFLLTALVSSRAASAFIGAQFPTRPRPADLLFDALPYVPWTQYLTDITLIVQLGLLLWYLSRGRWRQLPAMVTMFSIMEIMRAAFVVLTPMAGPLGNGAYYGIIHATQNGEFPSGHVASAFIFFLFIDAAEAPLLSKVMLALVGVECLTLLLSHGHYSVDIVGGLLLSYFVFHEFTEGRLFSRLRPLVSP